MSNKAYGRVVTDEEIKQFALEALCWFKETCQRHNLRYQLAFGTLLGAVRHKGFIPWDDDIDVLMPRKDFDRLCGMIDQVRTDDWELMWFEHEPRFLFPWMKLCNRKTAVLPPRLSSGLVYGLSTDIFPLDMLDGATESEARESARACYSNLKKAEKDARKLGVLHTGGINTVKRVVKQGLFRLNGAKVSALRQAYADAHQAMRSHPFDPDGYAGLIYNKYRSVWKMRDMVGEGDEYSTLTFEGIPFAGPCDPDAVLRKTYGDYMKLPPEDKRVSPHTFTAYYRQP